MASQVLEYGTFLGPYEIVSSLGQGGMGHVYKARDTRLHRSVAVKVLSTSLALNVGFRERFEREAQLIATLSHPYICGLYDVGEQDGVLFLVMEYLEGLTLAERLERGPLPIDQVLRYATQIADALDKAHRQGIVHRDLKPGNIILAKSGVKLLDFGLASRTDVPDATSRRSVTGTPQYMSPEQLEGGPVDPRSDVFSFGLVLYEMISGQRVNAVGALNKDMTAGPPRLSTLRPTLPVELEDLVDHCLARHPDDRWQSAHDILIQLKHLVTPGGSRHAGAAQSANRSRVVPWIAVCSFLSLAGALTVWLSRHRAESDLGPLRFQVAPPPPPSGFTGSGRGLAFISPDARHLAWMVSNREGRASLAVQSLETMATTYLDGTEGATSPFWSPDGHTIGFFSNQQLKKVDIAGGPVETLAAVPRGRGADWGDQGVIVFAPDVTGPLYAISERGGTPTPVTYLDPTRAEVSHQRPAFLPDGRFTYLAVTSGGTRHESFIGSLRSKARIPLMVSVDTAAIYASPGYLLALRERALLAFPFDLRRLSITGPPAVVNNSVLRSPEPPPSPGPTPFSISRNGVVAFMTHRLPKSQLVWFDHRGTRLDVAARPDTFGNPALSANGRFVAVQRSDEDGGSSLWRLDLTRQAILKLKSHATAAVWGPKGDEFAVATSRGPLYRLLRTRIGFDESDPLIESPDTLAPTDWSADGRFILYERHTLHSKSDLWVLPLADLRKPVPFLTTAAREWAGRFSPDGRYIAYTSDGSGRAEVYIKRWPPTGATWQVSVDGGEQPVWHPDGRRLFYIARHETIMSVPIRFGEQEPALGGAAPLIAIPYGETMDSRSYGITADGRRFLVNVKVNDMSGPVMVANVCLRCLQQSGAAVSLGQFAGWPR